MDVWGESSFSVNQGHMRSWYFDVKVKNTHGLYAIVKNDHKIPLEKGHRGLWKSLLLDKEFFVSITSLYIRFWQLFDTNNYGFFPSEFSTGPVQNFEKKNPTKVRIASKM